MQHLQKSSKFRSQSTNKNEASKSFKIHDFGLKGDFWNLNVELDEAKRNFQLRNCPKSKLDCKKRRKIRTFAALVLALAHLEIAVSDLSESKNDTELLFRAAKSNAFHLQQFRKESINFRT